MYHMHILPATNYLASETLPLSPRNEQPHYFSPIECKVEISPESMYLFLTTVIEEVLGLDQQRGIFSPVHAETNRTTSCVVVYVRPRGLPYFDLPMPFFPICATQQQFFTLLRSFELVIREICVPPPSDIPSDLRVGPLDLDERCELRRANAGQRRRVSRYCDYLRRRDLCML